ncbi:MAG: SufD family Fe-S cluster assembly protein [Rickettsiales bacterium]|nr:SufD family Fe-S cluster assembly protein [Rickettsiales bacterium]
MNYLWQEFNIKTFPAETIVFKDGVFMPELSTLESCIIDKKYDLPVHIIYAGEIAGENNINIEINIPGQKVFLTAKIQNNLPAFLNIFVKNTGKKSFFRGQVLAQNYSELNISAHGHHLAPETGIILSTKVVAHSGSVSKLTGAAEIEKNCTDCDSDIGFSALAAPNARIEFTPKQLIRSTPAAAGHSASLYRGSRHQIEYLRESGLSGAEVKAVLEEAFLFC